MAPRVGLPAPRSTPPIAPDRPSQSWKAATSGRTLATMRMISGSDEKSEPQRWRTRMRRTELSAETATAMKMVQRDAMRAR